MDRSREQTPLILFRREIEGTCRRDPEEPPSHAAAGEGNRLGRRWRAVRADRPRPLLASRRTPAPLELQATVPDYMVPFALILQQGEQPSAIPQSSG
jgi:hypothetical protein